MARMAMLIDLTRCIGCDACTVACKQENGTPQDVFFARVLNVEHGSYPNVKRTYIPVLCNHCENPACLKACPNKAIFRREDGIVLIDQDRCRSAGACVSACPYGNIILSPKADKWYLSDDTPYERDFVRPRLHPTVARKCTLCAHRVDEGLEPACVVACPTTARIFGDVDNPESKISRYVTEQKELTARDPFKLIPEAGTEPANMYLGTMAAQESRTLGGSAPAGTGAALPEAPPLQPELPSSPVGAGIRAILITIMLLLLTTRAIAQGPPVIEPEDLWGESSCAGCHGAGAMGGIAPPLASTTLEYRKFHQVVRDGKGMMPGTPSKEMPDSEVEALFGYVKKLKLDPSQVPVSYKVSSKFTTRSVGIAFAFITLIAFLLSLKVLAYWLGCAGIRGLWPHIRKLGYLRAAGIALKSLIVEGLFVGHLYKMSKHRWAMHGLLIYGFLLLGLADILQSIFNPTRGEIPLSHPIKLIANFGGLAVLLGIVYVRIRYRTDKYIDNGLTLGRDYLFLNLLALTIVSGFLVEIFGYARLVHWVMPTYMLHLVVVSALFVSAPFTRFSHVFVVPALIAMTRLVEAITEAGIDLGFSNEPSPGRHHKSLRIAESVLQAVDPGNSRQFRLRYYP